MNQTSEPLHFHTTRLHLRPLLADDLDDLLSLDNDPEVMRFLNGGAPVSRQTMAAELLPDMLSEADAHPGLGFWAVETRQDGGFAGWVSLRAGVPPGAPASLGFRLHRAVWGSGLATEGARVLIDHAFITLGLRELQATTYVDNVASQRVLKKLGFIETRRFRYVKEPAGLRETFVAGAEPPWPGDDIEYRLYRSEP